MKRSGSAVAIWGLCLVSLLCAQSQPKGTITGPLIQWQSVTLSFVGPKAGELDNTPNPFLDFRLNVTFTGPTGTRFIVPGYFDGDGKGGAKGRIWRVEFTPDEKGTWTYRVSFRKGAHVAIDLNPQAGIPVAFNGQKGTFNVATADRTAPGFLKTGRLEYVGAHYLKFRDGNYWIKGGTDSPEDLLAYAGFDNTQSGSEFPIKTYKNHVLDWQAGDPDWGKGRGKGIIGAVNYLADQHVNLIYLMPMNIGGDGKNVWPFAGKISPQGNPGNDNLHYDISKLGQWNRVFDHAQRRSIVLHIVFNEAEKANKRELGGTHLGIERKLYYREIIARFGHHNAIIWNLCEEYNIGGLDLTADNIKRFARYIKRVDPYDHPLTVHHAGDPVTSSSPFIGDTLFDITSIQIGNKDIEPVVEAFRALTQKAGRPLPVAVDEFTVTTRGEAWMPVDNAQALRIEKMWPAYLSGGQVEFILEDLLRSEDFRKNEALWQFTWYARKFLQKLPFWEMEPMDGLLDGDATYQGSTCAHDAQVFAKGGVCYAIYFPSAQATGTLDLAQASGLFQMQWYNPRTGQFVGKKSIVRAGGPLPIGPAPTDADQDWALLLMSLEAKRERIVHYQDEQHHRGYGLLIGNRIRPLTNSFTELALGKRNFRGKRLNLERVRLLPPVMPSKIICFEGIFPNTAHHTDGAELDNKPVFILKPPTTIIGEKDSILLPQQMSQQVECEGELAVIIGKTIHNVTPTQALDAVFGYTCFNDVTARDLVRRDPDVTRAKGFDSFGPLGPWIVTHLDPNELRIQTLLNQTPRQVADISDMSFEIPFLISSVSQVMTLLPGDVIAFGAPGASGVLKPGDTIQIQIDKIGTLTNRVE